MPPPQQDVAEQLERIADTLDQILAAINAASADVAGSDIPERIAKALDRISKLSEHVRQGEISP